MPLFGRGKGFINGKNQFGGSVFNWHSFSVFWSYIFSFFIHDMEGRNLNALNMLFSVL